MAGDSRAHNRRPFVQDSETRTTASYKATPIEVHGARDGDCGVPCSCEVSPRRAEAT